MNRRAMLGGLITAGAMAAVPDSVAHAADSGSGLNAFDGSAPVRVQSTAAQPGLHYHRFPATAFVPATDSPYTDILGGIQNNAAGPVFFICPMALAHGTTLKELEVYLLTGAAQAQLALFRFGDTLPGSEFVLPVQAAPASGNVQVLTYPLDHVVDAVNFGYELYILMGSGAVVRGARVGSIAPTGLITVPQVRKLDTRSGAKPLVNSITTVDLAPQVPAGARAALVNVTATNTVNGGFLTAFPGTLPTPPDTSVLNWTVSNTDIANNAVVELGGGTTIKLFVGGSAGTATHLLCDVTGYFI